MFPLRLLARLTVVLLALGALAGLLWWWCQRGRAGEKPPAPLTETPRVPEGRAVAARARVEAGLRDLCRQAGLDYPPQALYLRAFKREAEMEVWARGEEPAYRLLLTLPVTASSGLPGPKRREGDLQVPEGFYEIEGFNPDSSFHLSLRVNYPNAAARVWADPAAPGSDIYVHGRDCSIGCLPLGDAGIEQLYILAWDATRGTPPAMPIHIFPARMGGLEWEKFAAEEIARDGELAAFWASLQPAYEAFEATRRLPRVSVREGVYRVEPAE